MEYQIMSSEEWRKQALEIMAKADRRYSSSASRDLSRPKPTKPD